MTQMTGSDSGLPVGRSINAYLHDLHLPNNKNIAMPFHASQTKCQHVILIIPNK